MRTKRTNLILSFVWMLSLVAAGCSKEAFKVVESTNNQGAPGEFIVSAKVDILLAEDNTGSKFSIYDEIRYQLLQSFLPRLEASGWNYHFATSLLTRSRPLTQIMTSKHDGNWALDGRNAWIPPYPGAEITDPFMMIPSEFFTEPNSYSDFVDTNDIDLSVNGYEPGFEVIRKTLYDETVGTGFLRHDATAIVIVMSNGNDTSEVNQCFRPDGIPIPCADGSDQKSFDKYLNEFNNLTYPNDNARVADLKFYSAVATRTQDNCLGFGARSRAGSRYRKMATALGGRSYDICSQQVSQIFQDLSQHLKDIALGFRTRYLVIASPPNVDTIRVVKYPKNNRNAGVELPRDPNGQNGYGWDYIGGPMTVPVIDYPKFQNEKTGYVIQLFGEARLVGSDQADVTFKPAGASDAGG